MTLLGSNDASQPSCPQVRPYEQIFRDGLAAELEHLPTGSLLRAAITDYWILRADAMACANRYP